MLLRVAHIAGYITLGCMVDRGYLTAARFLSVSSLGMGLSCGIFILSYNFATMMATIMLFGLCVTVYPIVNPSLVYDYIEESKQSMAMASRALLYAPLCLTMGPLVRKYYLVSFAAQNMSHLHNYTRPKGKHHSLRGSDTSDNFCFIFTLTQSIFFH